MNRSLALGLAAFALTASLLAIPAIASHHGAGNASEAHASEPITREQMESRIAARFAAADTDSSGTIDRSEAEARHTARQADRHARRFARLDTNSDGEISLAERDAARARHPQHRPVSRSDMIVENRNMRARLTPEELAPLQSGAAHGTNRFDRMDSDNDGVLSLAEVSARPLAMFERADANGDGIVTRAERRVARQAMHEQRRMRRQ